MPHYAFWPRGKISLILITKVTKVTEGHETYFYSTIIDDVEQDKTRLVMLASSTQICKGLSESRTQRETEADLGFTQPLGEEFELLSNH